MFRDQRLKDNWALIHSVDQANKSEDPVAIAFNLFYSFLGSKARQLGFMLRRLQKLYLHLQETIKIPFFMFQVIGGIRVGFDIGGGSGTFAARMEEINVIVTDTLKIYAPFNEFIAARGLYRTDKTLELLLLLNGLFICWFK